MHQEARHLQYLVYFLQVTVFLYLLGVLREFIIIWIRGRWRWRNLLTKGVHQFVVKSTLVKCLQLYHNGYLPHVLELRNLVFNNCLTCLVV